MVPVPTKPSCIRESPPSRPERREALVRVEDVRLDPRWLVGLAAELGHGPRQTHPVEKLLLAALLDRGQRRLAPGRPVASLERRVQDAVGRDIRIEEVVLGRQERVGPARRGDERDTPGAPRQGAGAGGAEVEAAPGHRRGRVELITGRRLGEACDAGPLRDHLPPVAVDLEGHHSVVEALAVVIEEHHRVQKRVSELVVQRPVCVRHVEPFGQEALGQGLGARWPRTWKVVSLGSSQTFARTNEAWAHGRGANDSQASTQNGGMMSSLKFSYWSSPHSTMKSGRKSSRSLRILRKCVTRNSRWCTAALRPSSFPYSRRMASGHPDGCR